MKILFTFIFCAITIFATGQITCVDYKLSFNNETNQYDMNLVILGGAASSSLDRNQYNSQISIVVPTGLEVKLTDLNMPLQYNQDFTSTVPAKWTLTDIIIAPLANPSFDFYSIITVLSPISFYNELNVGDEVYLFSFTVGQEGTHNEEVRLFRNDTDPTSLDPGMGGGNFSNTFKIGNSGNIYTGASDEGCVVLSTNELSNFDVVVFPNPFQNDITIELPKDVKSIQVISITGIVYNTINSSLNGKLVIPTTHYPNGIYIVRMENTKGQVTTKKIVKL